MGTDSKTFNLEVIDTLETVKHSLRTIENQIAMFFESPNEISEKDFDFTTIEAALARIEAVKEYFTTGELKKEIPIRTY